MPRPASLEAIARALACPVCALLVPDGWRATELRLTPDTVAAIRRGGRVEAERVAAMYAADLPGILLAAVAVPARPPNPDGRGRRRRTRAEVLAGIAEAKAARAARDRLPAGSPAGGGAGRVDADALHGIRADGSGVEPLSTLPPAPIVTAEG